MLGARGKIIYVLRLMAADGAFVDAQISHR